MKKFLNHLPVLVLAALLCSCRDSGTSTNTQIPDPVTQPEANAAVFQRTCDGINGLIERKEYKKAEETLALFKKFKLTAEQQKTVERLQAQIPKAN